jgi:hypothetical protein
MTAPDGVVFRLDPVVRRYPARHYVLADDTLRMLAAIRKIWLVEAGPAEEEAP